MQTIESPRVFYPTATLKCVGPRLFRSQPARDVACLLDIDPEVVSWSCFPEPGDTGEGGFDFVVLWKTGAETYADAYDRPPGDIASLRKTVEISERTYKRFDATEVNDGFRLRNTKDLLRYGSHVVSLGDRVRMLATLDEQGSLSFAECLTVFREGNPVAGLSSMILASILEVELDDALIGPETAVRRIRS